MSYKTYQTRAEMKAYRFEGSRECNECGQLAGNDGELRAENAVENVGEVMKATRQSAPVSAAGSRPQRAVTRKLLTPQEVAELTGLSLNTLAQWRSQRRRIPYLKIGRKPMYDPTDVQNYLEGCRVSVSDPKERRQN